MQHGILSVVVVMGAVTLGCEAAPAIERPGLTGREPGPGTPMWSGVETCGNGIDDDADGAVDQGCPCFGDARQSCWPGEPGKRGIGACTDGLMHCLDRGEFSTWGPCVGAFLPIDEIAGNGVDENCDGSDTPPVCTPSEFGPSCGDGRDDDCDGLLDCADPDCFGAIAESGEACHDSRDQDCDGLVDCADPSCGDIPACATDECPAGTTVTYRSPGLGFGGSGIDCEHAGPVTTRSCEPGEMCPPGQVAIDVAGFGFDFEGSRSFVMCVPAPPECTGGDSPVYAPAAGGWLCLPPCMGCLIQYGGIYDNELHCAPTPPTCSGGLTPTFIYETETWECEPMCDGGLYDPHDVAGVTVCVPC